MFPSRPSVYAIRINTHGLSYSLDIFFHEEYETTGVEISTLRLTRENNVVAAVPMQILAISPISSFSTSVSSLSELALLDPGSFSSALISSCDNTPSIFLLLLSNHRSDSNCIIFLCRSRQCSKLAYISNINIQFFIHFTIQPDNVPRLKHRKIIN